MTQRRKRSPAYPPALIARARDMSNAGRTPTDIERAFELEGVVPTPHLNTIKLWVRGLRRDSSEPWSMGSREGGPDPDAAEVLPVLAAVVRDTGGAITTLTTWEARVITRIRYAAPKLAPLPVWNIARGLIRAEEDGPAASRDALHAIVADAMAGSESPIFEVGVAAGYFDGTAPGTATKETPYDA